MVAKFGKWVSDHKTLCVFLTFIIILIFYLIWKNGANASNKFAGIFTPLIVAVVTIYLSNRQHNIADAQRAVAKEQADTAKESKRIAAQKLRLDLFDKRYDAYGVIIDFFTECYELSFIPGSYIQIDRKNIEEYLEPEDRTILVDNLFSSGMEEIIKIRFSIAEKKKKVEVALSKIKFLFNEEIHDEIALFSIDVRDLYYEKCSYILKEIAKYRKNYDNYKNITHDSYGLLEERQLILASRLNNEITEAVRPFLEVPEE